MSDSAASTRNRRVLSTLAARIRDYLASTLGRPGQAPCSRRPTRQTSDTDYYEIVQSAATAEILPGLKTPIWGYNGTFPGPTIAQNPGRNVVVTLRNNLPLPTVAHLRGGAIPHDSDGYPTDFVLPAASYGDFRPCRRWATCRP
jgi:spore coat protein A